MLAELDHVEGDWAALVWAFGGAGVLTKHALLSVIFFNRKTGDGRFSAELFAKENTMRKPMLAVAGSCVIASLLFFVAPVFRQAFRISLSSWERVNSFTHFEDRGLGPELEAMARQAERNHDAEALAFLAVRHPKPSEGAKLAEKAVELEPQLTWIYGVVAVLHPELPQIEAWVRKLKQWDPDNALPYLISAESLDIGEVLQKNIPKEVSDQPPAWKAVMASAFQSAKLDNYAERLQELNHQVLVRYRFEDLYEALDNSCCEFLPTYTGWDSYRYGEWLLQSGEALEAQGDRKAAREKYVAVTRFHRTLNLAGIYVWEGFRPEMPQGAYRRLRALSEKEGRTEQAQLYGYLDQLVSRTAQSNRKQWKKRFAPWGLGAEVSRWNAGLVKAAGVTMLFFGGLVMVSLVLWITRGPWLRRTALSPGRLPVALGFGGGVGLLLASTVLYITYRPYAQIFQHYIDAGDESQVRNLSDFLSYAQTFPVDIVKFWFVVSILCASAFLLVILAFLIERVRNQPLSKSGQVQSAGVHN